MAKAPAFQFYPKDYLSDKNVRCMTLAERGAYIELICIEWNEQGLPNDEEDLSILSGLGKEWFGKSGEKVKKCFRVRGKKIVHPRLEKERKIQRQRRLECSKAGSISASRRKIKGKKPTPVGQPLNGASTTVQPKGNSSSSSSSTSSIPLKDKNKEGVFSPEWLPVETFKDFIEMRIKSKARPTDKAKELLIGKLDKLRKEGNDPKAVIEQSIMNSYKGFFPLKGQGGQNGKVKPAAGKYASSVK